jgi:hypothetical protein
LEAPNKIMPAVPPIPRSVVMEIPPVRRPPPDQTPAPPPEAPAPEFQEGIEATEGTGQTPPSGRSGRRLRAIPYDPEVVPAWEPDCKDRTHRASQHRGHWHYQPCPNCGCTDRPRQIKKFGGTSWALFWVGIFLLWPLLVVAFFTQEVWDVCPDCGERLEQTGTGF